MKNSNPSDMYTLTRRCIALALALFATGLVSQNAAAQVAVDDANSAVKELAAISQSSVETVLRFSDSHVQHGAHAMNNVVAAYPAVAGVSDWQWSFHNVNELPIIINKGDASRFIRLADVPGLQHGYVYSVQVRPIMTTGDPTVFGEARELSIIAEAPVEDDAISVDFRGGTGLEVNQDMVLSPKKVTGNSLDVTFGGWLNDAGNTNIGIANAQGEFIFKQEIRIEAGDKVTLDVRNMDAGMYSVIAQNDRQTRESTFKIERERGGETGLAISQDLRLEPKKVTGENLAVQVGTWIDQDMGTTIGIRDASGTAIFKQELRLLHNQTIELDVSQLGAGMYAVVAENNRETRESKFKVERARSGDTGLEVAQDLRVEPKKVTGERISVQVGGWINAASATTIGIMDQDGNVIVKQELRLEANATLDFDVRDLQAGMYSVIAQNERESRETKFKVERERMGDTGIEVSQDLRIEPKTVTGRTITVRFGDWINASSLTKVGIRNAAGEAVIKQDVRLESGDALEFDVEALESGLYAVVVQNDRETRESRFKVERERMGDTGLEVSEAIRVAPKTVTGHTVDVELGDWIDANQFTTIGIMNDAGDMVTKQELRLEVGQTVTLDVKELEAGLYSVIAQNNRQMRESRFKVERERGASTELNVYPQEANGTSISVTVGSWVNPAHRTEMRVLDADGKLVQIEAYEAVAGEPVTLDISGLRNGTYSVHAINNNQVKETTFSVVRGRFGDLEQDVSIYPNPVRERDMSVKLGTWADGRVSTGMRLYDDNGQVKASKTARIQPGEVTLFDVSTLDNGDYTLVVVNGRERRTVRVSIRR